MAVLVVGGAGYIGSHTVKELLKKGYSVIVYDNLSTGFRENVLGGEFILGDLADEDKLGEVFSSYPIDTVMHFASFIAAGESELEPAKYYENNVLNSLKLLKICNKAKVNFIFSSSAAVYGEPQEVPITENHPLGAVNTYGWTKFMTERMLADFQRAYGFRYVSLRYFNAAGADVEGELRERHHPETHLIPLVLDAASGKRESIKVYGTNYPTPDGTCIRDYVHVSDLAQAHILAMESFGRQTEENIFNLGNGRGYSVREVISTAKKVTKKEFAVIETSRRQGDPAVLVSSSAKIQKILSWQPKYPDLETIVQTAWATYKK